MSKNHFFISLNELQFCLNNHDEFFICRIYIDPNFVENSLILSFLNDIPNKLTIKDYKLVLVY